jgi:hypothetical protein
MDQEHLSSHITNTQHQKTLSIRHTHTRYQIAQYPAVVIWHQVVLVNEMKDSNSALNLHIK